MFGSFERERERERERIVEGSRRKDNREEWLSSVLFRCF